LFVGLDGGQADAADDRAVVDQPDVDALKA
jgi:hypothetical protein